MKLYEFKHIKNFKTNNVSDYLKKEKLRIKLAFLLEKKNEIEKISLLFTFHPL